MDVEDLVMDIILEDRQNYSQIGKLTLARLLMAYDDIVSTDTPSMSHVEEVLQLYSKLMKKDPPHYQYYKDDHSLVLLKQSSGRCSRGNQCSWTLCGSLQIT